jgi:WD40 repeat protein/serine/threonine protein kinase
MNSSSSSSDRDPLEQLAAEFLDRRRGGEPVSPSEYAEQYPRWAEQILEFFPALEVMEGLKPGSRDQTDSFAGLAEAAGTPRLERLGEYRILREIGHGGMGVVYEAIQESLGRRVALKILPMHGRIDATQMQRFQLEARSAARLHHPSIVPVYGVGEAGGIHYYVMQYIAGHGLDVILDDLRRLRTGEVGSGKSDTDSIAVARSLLTGRFAASEPERGGGAPSATFPEESGGSGTAPDDRSATAASLSSVLSSPTESGYYRAVARLGVQVAGALAHAHAQGVLHRDIKPSNLLLDVGGHVWVTDFGLAKLEGAEGPTRTDDIIGTLRFMGPERFEGWSDRRSDIYGLGVTLYEMLTLRPAFDAGTRLKLIEQVIHDPPLAPRRVDPRIPRDLETIVLKSIAKEPGERYATAEALASDLENYLADKPILARRSGPVERAWRWCRRNKAAAGLLAASGVAALALVGVVVGSVYNGQLKAKNLEVSAANLQLKAAHEREEAIRYFNNMLMAEREWTISDVGRVLQLLDACRPKPDQADLRGWEWHYLKRQCHTELKTIPGPQTQAMGVAFSPDDRQIATTGYDDKGVRIWNAETGKLEKTLLDLAIIEWAFSEGLAYSPDGTLLAASCGCATAPGKVVVWDTATWTPRILSTDLCGESNNVAFSPDSKRLAAVSGEPLAEGHKKPRLVIWDMESREKCVEIEGDEGEMGWISVAFSPDGNSIAAASGKLDQDSTENGEGAVKIWNSWTGGKPIKTIRHRGPLTCVAFSPDGARLATAGHDRTLRIWDVKTGHEIRALLGHTQVPFKVVFSPAGNRLVSVSDDNSARVWDPTTGEALVLRGHTREVHGVAYSHDGRRLATASMDGTVKIWDAVTGKNALTLPGRAGDWVMGLSISPDGRQIATAGVDKRVKVYDVEKGQQLDQFKEITHPIWYLTYSRDGRVIATGSGHWNEPKKLGQITLWDAETGAVKRTIEAHAGVARRVAFSPEGSRIATAGGEQHTDIPLVSVWDTTTGKEIMSCTGHSVAPVALAYSRDGQFLASGGWDSLLFIWDANAGTPIHRIKVDELVIWDLAFSPDSARLASAGFEGTVKVWDVATGEKDFEFRGHKSAVWCVTFSPDGNRAASGGEDGTVKVWDARTGQETLTLRGHADAVLRVAFSPDGNLIASSSKDGTVKIWDGSPWVEPAPQSSQALRINGTR